MNIREQMINEIVGDKGRVQYDSSDEIKIASSARALTEATVLMIEALGAYVDTSKLPVDENSADLMKGARHDVIYAWSTIQGATSMIAHMLRFDGDEAYRRVIEAANSGDPDDGADLSGL